MKRVHIKRVGSNNNPAPALGEILLQGFHMDTKMLLDKVRAAIFIDSNFAGAKKDGPGQGNHYCKAPTAQLLDAVRRDLADFLSASL